MNGWRCPDLTVNQRQGSEAFESLLFSEISKIHHNESMFKLCEPLFPIL